LTEKGETIAPTVRRALGDLAQSFRLVRDESNSVLVISTMQTIAGNWLAPRLGSFQLLHPEYTVRLDISPHTVDLESEGVDVVIRSGKGIWSGLTSPSCYANFHAGLQPPLYRARGRPKRPNKFSITFSSTGTTSGGPYGSRPPGFPAMPPSSGPALM
jgi:LysR family glycine cleavage system transcriptional activator